MRRGTRVGSGHVNITADGSNLNEEIIDAVDDATDHAGDAGEKAGDRYGRRFSERFRERMEGFRGRVAGRLNERLGREGREAGENAGEQAGQGFVERVGKKAREAGDRAAQEMGDRFSSQPEKIRRGIDRAFSDEFIDRIATRFADRLGQTISSRMQVILDEQRRLIEESGRVSGNRGGGRDSDFGDRIGRLLGSGSRNNFLNLIGRSVAGLINLTTKAAKSAATLFKNFQDGFNSLEEGAKFGRRLLAGFDNSIGRIGASLPGLLAGILAVAAAASVLASVLSALTAIITALLATITSALVGGLTVLGGTLLAVVASVGLLTAAFTSLTEKQKASMADTFGPLKDLLIGIGQVVLRDLIPAFKQWATNLRGALNLLVPLAGVMGAAFGEAGSILSAALSGPGFRNFITTMTELLPAITTRLSSALGGFLNGMLGLFAAVMPFVLQFSNYLDRVATRFSNWANSARGQNAIVDFTKRALDSLKSLWNFTREFFGFLGDLLFSPQAQKAGNSMFDSLAKSFRGFRDAIARAQADGSLERWFKDAAEFAGDLKVLLIGLKDVFKTLASSETLSVLGDIARVLGKILTALSKVDKIAGGALFNPLGAGVKGFTRLVDIAAGRTDDLGKTITSMVNKAVSDLNVLRGGAFAVASDLFGSIQSAVSSVVSSVTTSIAGASTQYLGAASPQGPRQYKNPYVAFANSLIKDGPSVAALIASAIKSINAQVANAVAQAAKSQDGAQVRDSLLSVYQTVRQQGQAIVEAARQNLNSAAQRLASASSAREASRALAAVRRAQAGLSNAIAAQKRLNRAADLLNQQRTIRSSSVNALLAGLRVQNATLAEYATARARIALRIEEATAKLQDAITLRDNFKQQISDSIKTFGSLVSATAETINGVAQALTADDVIGNLEDRLGQIKAFQENLRILLASGLSDAAYKQLVEAGVEGGAATAAALVAGGQSAVDAVNSLIGQIGQEADVLGSAASNRMYQAGVDMAQGLLDGLKSLDAQLASAAATLGQQIANSLKNALGIRSPSRVAYELMGYWGDGLVQGLDAQGARVGSASASLADRISASPEVAAYAARQAEAGVSGNESGQKFRDLVVVTPTKDPHAVAMETLNEVTGRL